MVRRKILSVGIAVISLAACAGDDAPTDTTAVTDTTITESTNDTAQIANPASEYCVAQGGSVEIVDEANGQVGYCNLPDGQRIEEWEYFNSRG